MTFRSFTLNLSIILCEYFLKACATMTLISQFKSTFKSDCKAMSYELACWLPYFIFEHLTRRIKMHSPRAQPAVCQIFKCPGTWRTFRISPTSNERRPPIFRISLWLTYILSPRPAWLTQLSGRSVLLTPSTRLWDSPSSATGSRVCARRMAATSDKTVGESLSSLSFLEVDLKEGLRWYLQW